MRTKRLSVFIYLLSFVEISCKGHIVTTNNTPCLLKTIDTPYNIEQFQYNSDNLLIETTYINKSMNDTIREFYSYDEQNKVLSINNSIHFKLEFNYNEMGNLQKIGNCAELFYDNKGVLDSVVYNNRAKEVYSGGNLVEYYDEYGEKYSVTYQNVDRQGEIIFIKSRKFSDFFNYKIGNLIESSLFKYEYDDKFAPKRPTFNRKGWPIEFSKNYDITPRRKQIDICDIGFFRYKDMAKNNLLSRQMGQQGILFEYKYNDNDYPIIQIEKIFNTVTKYYYLNCH